MDGLSVGTDCGEVSALCSFSSGIYDCTVLCATASLTTLAQQYGCSLMPAGLMGVYTF